MIVFDLSCQDGHRFEGWFSSSEDFASQKSRGLLCCPQCGSESVDKAPMAPAVPRKGNQVAVSRVNDAVTDGSTSEETAQPVAGGKIPPEMPAQMREAMHKLAEIQAEALKTSKWVGDKFAEESRAIHYGERDNGPIHGEATMKEAQELAEEGIAVAPLLFPVARPDDIN
ncbi:MAG: DUF1178 family protein [Novosphingobium sp.]|nr:DUF1178 family protein [Novosphingobium sp.]